MLPQSWHFLNLKGTFFTNAGQQQATQGWRQVGCTITSQKLMSRFDYATVKHSILSYLFIVYIADQRHLCPSSSRQCVWCGSNHAVTSRQMLRSSRNCARLCSCSRLTTRSTQTTNQVPLWVMTTLDCALAEQQQQRPRLRTKQHRSSSSGRGDIAGADSLLHSRFWQQQHTHNSIAPPLPKAKQASRLMKCKCSGCNLV